MGSYICVYGCICRCGHACAFGVLRSARAGLPVALTLILLTLWGCGGQGTVEPTFQVPPTRTRPLPTPLPTPAVLPTPDCNGTFFKETGHTVCQPFLKFWQDNGGLPVFGYPITDLLQESVKDTGETYKAQYFERARFELHEGSGNTVVLGRVGALLHGSGPTAPAIQGALYFPETGHNLSGPFLKFWQDNGGLPVFGYPITEEAIEKNPVDGRAYTVQYFERARFELHPEQAGTSFEIQLGQLGKQLYAITYRK